MIIFTHFAHFAIGPMACSCGPNAVCEIIVQSCEPMATNGIHNQQLHWEQRKKLRGWIRLCKNTSRRRCVDSSGALTNSNRQTFCSASRGLALLLGACTVLPPRPPTSMLCTGRHSRPVAGFVTTPGRVRYRCNIMTRNTWIPRS